MFLITVKNLNIILVVYLVKKLIINNVAYTSKGSGVGIRPVWVAYTSNGPIRPKGRKVDYSDKVDNQIECRQ